MPHLKTITLIVLLLTASLLPAQEDSLYYYQDFGEKRVYYQYTEYGMMPVSQLPGDTLYVHDTVFVSDLDGFLKQYDCDLRQFVEKYGTMKAMVDSLNNVPGMRLYYNHFLPQDSTDAISNRFIVKEFNVSDSGSVVGSNPREHVDFERSGHTEDLVRREILFTVKDALQTERFLQNQQLMLRSISSMFSYMQADSLGIQGINLYFPDFSFKEKRAMTQFVKSVRVTMDASKNFKFKNTRLTVILNARNGMEDIDRDFQYCLMQEATEVIFLNEDDLIDHCYVRGKPMTRETLNEVGFFAQLISHFYIARYYTGDVDIRQLNLENFSPTDIAFVQYADYSENTWEIYLYMLIGIMALILVLFLLYAVCLPLSTLVNKHINSIIVILVVLIFEMIVLVVNMFQYMCGEDSFIFIKNNPHLLFILPLLLVLVIPLLVGIFKKKNLP